MGGENVNVIKAKLNHVYFERNKINEFEIIIENWKVHFHDDMRMLILEIRGHKSGDKLINIFHDIIDLLFLYLGGYPQIINIEKNGEIEDISRYARKYDTWDYFKKNNLAICEINAESINEIKIQEYRRLSQIPIYSLQNLVSTNYKHIIVNHRFTLLLHIIDGIVPDSIVGSMSTEIRNVFHHQGRVGNYMAKTYYLCKKNFFFFHKKYNCEILQLLRVNRYKFIGVLSDSRNWYSHFLPDNKKPLRLTNGSEMLFYFEIICYTIRLYLINEVGTSVKEEWIKEYLYTVHDWILEVKYGKTTPIKSKTYKINRGIVDMIRYITELAQSSNYDIVNTEKRD